MRTIDVTCTDNELVRPADVIQETPFYLRVSFRGTDTTIMLRKQNSSDEYFVGEAFGMEFTARG